VVLKQKNDLLTATEKRLEKSLANEKELSAWRLNAEHRASLESTTRDALNQALPMPWSPADAARNLKRASSAVANYVKTTNSLPPFAIHGLSEAFTRSLAVPVKEVKEPKDNDNKEPVLAVAVDSDGRGLKVIRRSGFSQVDGSEGNGSKLSVQRA